MSYYKSTNPEEQLDEAIQILRREVAKEYSKPESGQTEYLANKEQLRAQIVPTLKVKLNLSDRIFHSSKNMYELSQLSRKKDNLVQRNEDLISANPRVQLSTTIKDSFTELSENDMSVAVFAVEQLLQEPRSLAVPSDVNVDGFNNGLYRSNIGIRKLETTGATSAKTFSERRTAISDLFDEFLSKYIYSDNIFSKAVAQYGTDSQGVAKLERINSEIQHQLGDMYTELGDLQTELIEELNLYGIYTHFDTRTEVFWKKFKAKLSQLFSLVFSKHGNRDLPENAGSTQTESSTRREDFFSDLNVTTTSEHLHNSSEAHGEILKPIKDKERVD